MFSFIFHLLIKVVGEKVAQVEVVRYCFLPGSKTFPSPPGGTILVSPMLACNRIQSLDWFWSEQRYLLAMNVTSQMQKYSLFDMGFNEGKLFPDPTS